MTLNAPSSELAQDPRARRARKRPSDVPVQFAAEDGSLDTLEGTVRYAAGAALLTGVKGERWPVERERFDAAYEPVHGTQAGKAGVYRKKPLDVWVRQLTESEQVRAGVSGSVLSGGPDDWLVQYGPGDFGIVAAGIFDATYDLLELPS